MKHHPCLTLFVLLCCAFTVSNAQNRHKSYLVYRDSVANRDTLVFGGIILKDTPTNQQYSITLLAADREQVFTPHDIVGFYDGRVLRMSKSLFVDGRVQQLFLEEAGGIGNVFFFYKYLSPAGEAVYYYQRVVFVNL